MKHITSFIFIFSTISSLALAKGVDDLRWIAQNYPPYSYVDKSDQNKGVAIDVLDKILRKANSSKTTANVEIKTFSKIFVRMNNDKNTVFFPLARLPERESMFKWVGPIFKDQPVIFAKANSNITINSMADLKPYKIAGREAYHGVKQLGNLDNINFVESDTAAIKNLTDQADLAVCDKLSCLNSIETLGLKKQNYKIVYVLTPSDMYFAFNKDTDDAIVDEVREALK
jgi:polar amino acid transport system substrate-binding protein